MRRNRAAVITVYVDNTLERIATISKRCVGGKLDENSQVELTAQHDILDGLTTVLTNLGGKKRDALLLTKAGRIRHLDKLVSMMGSDIQRKRVIDGVAISGLKELDAAYLFLSHELKKLQAAPATKQARPVTTRSVPAGKVT